MDTLLAFFEVQCVGVEFYDLKDAALQFWSPVVLRREPDKKNVFVPRPGAGGPRMLGHIARAAAHWLSPLLLCQTLRVKGYVCSCVGSS